MAKGQHLICDLSGVPENICSDDEYLLNVGKKIADILGVEVLHHYAYNFHESIYPDGCSVILVLSASHISFHTFAKDESIAVDVFCCERANWQSSVLEILQKEMNPKNLTWHKEDRFDESARFILTNEELIEQYEKRVDHSVLIVSPTLHNDLGSFREVVVNNIIKRKIEYTYIYPLHENRLYTELLRSLYIRAKEKFPRKSNIEKEISAHVHGLGLPELIYPVPWEMGVYYFKNDSKVGFMEHPTYPQSNFVFTDEHSTVSFYRLIERLRESSTRSIEQTEREICDILNRFHIASMSLAKRTRNQPFYIQDEYDVQDLLHTILIAKFANIDREFYLHAGAANEKPDFYFTGHDIALEVKTTVSPSSTERKILKDIKSYKHDLTKDERVRLFIAFIYAPESKILQRKEEIITELQSTTDELRTVVVINP